MLLVVCQLSRDVIGYEDSGIVSLVRFDLSIVTFKQSFIVSQTVACPIILSLCSKFCVSPSMSRFKLITKENYTTIN